MKKLIMVIIAGVILQQTVLSNVSETAADLMKDAATEIANDRDANMQKMINKAG